MSDAQDDQQAPAQGLPAPPPILTLVLTVELNGNTSLNYLGEPEWAVGALRGMADKVEADMEERRKAAEELL